MATYHLSARIGQKGKAHAHAAYIAREGKYKGSDRYEDLEAKAYGNMPTWAEHNPAEFWQAADENERANGSTYRELEVALPRELTPKQRLELVQAFITQELGDKHTYQFAIHTPKAALEKGDQPHAHIMYSERIRDGIERDPEQYFKRYNAKNPDKGGAKKFSGGKSTNVLKAELLEQRERWANLQNAHLEKHGHTERVDHRSLKDQGIEQLPEKHLGGAGVGNTSKKNKLLELRAANAEVAQAQVEAIPIVDYHHKQELVRDFAKLKAEEFKAKLAEKAREKAATEKAERDSAERTKWEREQAEQQQQEDERKAKDAAAQQAQAELDRAATEKALKAEQHRQEEQEPTKHKARDQDIEL